MITVYSYKNGTIVQESFTEGPLPDNPLWVDVFAPTDEEEILVERTYNINLPTHRELRKIEALSRFSEENGVLFMTATIVSQSDSPTPTSDTVTFVLTRNSLITCRYCEPSAFRACALRLLRLPETVYTPLQVLSTLMDAIITRQADILDRLGVELDTLSHRIFNASPRGQSLNTCLRSTGKTGGLLTQMIESLHSTERLLTFTTNALESTSVDKIQRGRIRQLQNDIRALNNFADSLSHELGFLLNATLGLITVQQNGIIKIFSVAAVIFLPPTLVASIYGMNFEHMPELHWHYGYPVALGLMLMAAIIPYLFFKKKGWL